jgi:hypothetical protein
VIAQEDLLQTEQFLALLDEAGRHLPVWTGGNSICEDLGDLCAESRGILAQLVDPASMSALRAYWTKAQPERGFNSDLIRALAHQVVEKAHEYSEYDRDRCANMLDELDAEAVLAAPAETADELCDWLFEQERVRFEGTLCNKCHKPIIYDVARLGGKMQGWWQGTCSTLLEAIKQRENRPKKKKRNKQLPAGRSRRKRRK